MGSVASMARREGDSSDDHTTDDADEGYNAPHRVLDEPQESAQRACVWATHPVKILVRPLTAGVEFVRRLNRTFG